MNQPNSGQGKLSPADLAQIRSAIRKKYTEVAASSAGKFAYPTGKKGATALAYDPGTIRDAHPDLLKSFCGVGNPFSLGEIKPGSTILDIGCGAGFDLFVACRMTGERGRGYGLELTAAMANRAAENLAAAGISNFSIKPVDSEKLPFSDNFFDLVIANGVINLSPCKEMLFGEIFRVLKPGGRIQFADVMREGKLPSHLVGSLEAWSQ